jgi:hypothetical protein
MAPMIVEAEIRRIDQSWDLKTGIQQNFLVVEVLGVEVRAPCSEEQAVAVLQAVTQPREAAPVNEEEPRRAQSVFQSQEPQEEPTSMPAPVLQQVVPERKLAPIKRPERGDDVGIAQG